MALDNISRAVLEAAKNEADHVLKAAKRAADDKLAAARAAAEQDAERRFNSACRAIDEEIGRQLIQARGAANKELLAKKNARLRQVFDAAQNQILAFPEKDYAAVMRSLLERAAEGPGAVRVHPQDEPVFAQLVAELNKNRGPAAQITLDKAQPLAKRGGFMFVAQAYEVDQTLTTLLADIEREMAPRIAAQLFPGRA